MSEHQGLISYQNFLHREFNIVHAPYEPEKEFFEAIKTGNIKKVSKLVETTIVDKEGLGTLSQDPLRNIKYHLIISIASIARVCIEGGLPVSESFHMSDYFIQLTDQAKTFQEIANIHYNMSLQYTKRMKLLRKETICSRPIAKCMDYIYENLHTRITIEDLCSVTGLSNAYISRLFKKETGHTVNRYILLKKIETAKSMLTFSDYSIADISASLAFPSQSYFTKVFKDECDITPKQYRNRSLGYADPSSSS